MESMSDWRCVQSVAEFTVLTILISKNEKYFECFMELQRSLINVIYEWPKDRIWRTASSASNGFEQNNWVRTKRSAVLAAVRTKRSAVLAAVRTKLSAVLAALFSRHLPAFQVLRQFFLLLPVVSNCQTFTWGRRGGSLVSASVLLSYFWNYLLSWGL